MPGASLPLPTAAVRRSLMLAAALAVLGVAALATAGAAAAQDPTIERFAGTDRVDTAAQIAEGTFEPETTDTALVAQDRDFPDALAAAALSGLYDAPVLLTGRDDLPGGTVEAIDTLDIERIVILGGPAAVSGGVEAQLAELAAVERIAGADRYETAADIARHVDDDTGFPVVDGRPTVLLANGETFADALTAGSLAAAGAHPILLTEQDALPAETASVIEDLAAADGRVIAIGGSAVIADAVLLEAQELGIESTRRYSGSDRGETAAEFADALTQRYGFTDDAILLARGDDFPDALAGGPRAGALGAPILLADQPPSLGRGAADWLEAQCPDIGRIDALGGPSALSDATVAYAVSAAVTCVETELTLTYEIGTAGTVHADFDGFRDRAAEVLNDPRGWSLDGDIAFEEVESGGDFRLWLASPQVVANAAPVCSPNWSCRVGDDVYVNDMRWREGTATYADRPLFEYRWYVVNHEVGHWLGWGHPDCTGAGDPAPVMQQQSIDLEGCVSNVWPVGFEREAVREWWLE